MFPSPRGKHYFCGYMASMPLKSCPFKSFITTTATTKTLLKKILFLVDFLGNFRIFQTKYMTSDMGKKSCYLCDIVFFFQSIMVILAGHTRVRHNTGHTDTNNSRPNTRFNSSDMIVFNPSPVMDIDAMKVGVDVLSHKALQHFSHDAKEKMAASRDPHKYLAQVQQ